MIRSKKDLKLYIQIDTMMNKGQFSLDFKSKMRQLIDPDYIYSFLYALRHEEYYKNCCGGGILRRIYWHIKFKRVSIKCGFSIALNTLGYGVVIPHYGTIVVGSGNQIGNYAVLHTSTCIAAGKKVIGDGLYLSTGAKLVHDYSLGEGITVAANSLLNRGNGESYCLFAGMPAKKVKDSKMWYMCSGDEYARRYNESKKLYKQHIRLPLG